MDQHDDDNEQKRPGPLQSNGDDLLTRYNNELDENPVLTKALSSAAIGKSHGGTRDHGSGLRAGARGGIRQIRPASATG